MLNVELWWQGGALLFNEKLGMRNEELWLRNKVSHFTEQGEAL